MSKNFFKFYLAFVVLLTLVGSAALAMLNNYLTSFEKEQQEYANLTATPTVFITPTPEMIEVVVEKYRYSITVPASFVVTENENVVKGASEAGMTTYTVISSTETFNLDITDAYGHKVNWTVGEELEAYKYVVLVPSNFEVRGQGYNAEDYIVSEEENSEYKWAKEYCEMASLVTYEFTECLAEPEMKIFDNLQGEIAVTFEDNRFEYTLQTGKEEIPGYLMTDREALLFAEQWSLFMTDDIWRYNLEEWDFNNMDPLQVSHTSPSGHGLSIIEPYLVKDSYLYSVAVKWANGPDIKLTSRHYLAAPFFTDEKVENFVQYSDTMFSVDIFFVKKMLIGNSKKKKDDITKCTIYFVKNEEFDASHGSHEWLMADIITNVNSVEQND